jgi:pimeloyl-ACP methyl ester carboxylesterase
MAQTDNVLPRRAYTDGPFGQIHFQQLGTGTPLVLLHQAPMTSEQFANVCEPLARRGFQAIGIDMPGFGLSDPADFIPGVAEYARVVVPVLDALGIADTAILGHHTGALVATETAIRFPDRITALIVNGPLLVSDADFAFYMTGMYLWEQDFVAQADAGHMVQLFAIRNRLAHGEIPAARLSDYVVQALTGRAPFWHGHHAAYQYRQGDTLPAVTQPGLILTNTGDSIYPDALRAHALRPDFAYFALEGGGVDIVDQQPEAWADAVAAFLETARAPARENA